LFPSTTTTRVSSACVASISIFLAIFSNCTAAQPRPRRAEALRHVSIKGEGNGTREPSGHPACHRQGHEPPQGHDDGIGCSRAPHRVSSPTPSLTWGARSRPSPPRSHGGFGGSSVPFPGLNRSASTVPDNPTHGICSETQRRVTSGATHRTPTIAGGGDQIQSENHRLYHCLPLGRAGHPRPAPQRFSGSKVI